MDRDRFSGSNVYAATAVYGQCPFCAAAAVGSIRQVVFFPGQVKGVLSRLERNIKPDIFFWSHIGFFVLLDIYSNS